MAYGCDCNVGLSNTGKPGCVPLFSVVNNLIVVPLYDNDGARNGIDLSTTLPQWVDLTNEIDASKRWFPLPSMENVEVPKADSQFEEANSGRMAFLREGKRSLMGEMWGDDATTTFLGKLYKGRCVDFGVYIVDVNENLIGSKSNGFLYPIPVDNASWDPKFAFATDSTVQKIMLGFDFDRLFDDSTMYQITSEEGGIEFSTLQGLIDINFTDLAATSTATTYQATSDYGTALFPILIKGITEAETTLYNVTTASVITLDTYSENPDGTYTLDYSISGGVTPGDVLKVTVTKVNFMGSKNVIAV